MSNKIVYLITDSGVDGREQTKVIYASYDEQERDKVHEASKNKNWHAKSMRIAEVERETKQALAKLDGISRLLLGLDQKDI